MQVKHDRLFYISRLISLSGTCEQHTYVTQTYIHILGQGELETSGLKAGTNLYQLALYKTRNLLSSCAKNRRLA